MIPDFSKNTVDTLAKRAAYTCSNPDCRVNTVGPNSDPDKSTKIGEAAHIYGARIGSKRFNSKMTDSARAEITNSIWLCRNCHKLIDTDEQKYSANLLFLWREKHEEFVASTLGNKTDKIAYENQLSLLKEFNEYSPIIKRIIIDEPDGWEFRLAAELMRYLNNPLFRKLKDLKGGLYLKDLESINSDRAFEWIQNRLAELGIIVPPVVGLLDQLNKSFGEPGKPGDKHEIHHVAKLMKKYLEHVIAFEEKIQFVNVPDEYQRTVHLLKNIIGSQVEKLENIPLDLDEVVSYIENNTNETKTAKVFERELVFEIPEYLEKELSTELDKLKRNQVLEKYNSSGCLTILLFIVGIPIFFLLI